MMYRESWTSFAELQETSFDGLLVLGSNMPFNPWRSSEEDVPEGAYAFVQGTVNSPGQAFRFLAESVGENAVKRLIGCVIMGSMPEEGVEEAVRTLRDIYVFNSETIAKALPAPARRHHMTGMVVAKLERPELVISE